MSTWFDKFAASVEEMSRVVDVFDDLKRGNDVVLFCRVRLRKELVRSDIQVLGIAGCLQSGIGSSMKGRDPDIGL